VKLEVLGVSASNGERVEVVVASCVPGVGGGGPSAFVLLGALPGHPVDGVPAGVGAQARLGSGGCKHRNHVSYNRLWHQNASNSLISVMNGSLRGLKLLG